jgi:hypothetical protein
VPFLARKKAAYCFHAFGIVCAFQRAKRTLRLYALVVLCCNTAIKKTKHNSVAIQRVGRTARGEALLAHSTNGWKNTTTNNNKNNNNHHNNNTSTNNNTINPTIHKNHTINNNNTIIKDLLGVPGCV